MNKNLNKIEEELKFIIQVCDTYNKESNTAMYECFNVIKNTVINLLKDEVIKQPPIPPPNRIIKENDTTGGRK